MKPPELEPIKGTPPVLEWISPERLGVDPTYQRTLEAETSATLIRRLARGWDWGLCQPINVARRADGSLWVIDGQHRRAAAMLRGDIPHLPCVVQSIDNVAEEATAFVALNRARRPLSGVDVFKAELAAGGEQAKQIMGLIDEAGLAIARHGNFIAWKPGEIFCIPTIAKGLKRYGPKVTGAALAALAQAYPGQVLRYAGQLLEGLLIFHSSALDDRPASTAEVLRTREQAEWIELARRKMAQHGRRALAMNAALCGSAAHAETRGEVKCPPIVAHHPRFIAPPPAANGLSWCEQCEQRIAPPQAAACRSRFCKLKPMGTAHVA